MSRDATPADVLSGAARWCVVHGDAVEAMRALPDRSVAHVVTDPPYLGARGASWEGVDVPLRVDYEPASEQLLASLIEHAARVAGEWLVVFNDYKGDAFMRAIDVPAFVVSPQPVVWIKPPGAFTPNGTANSPAKQVDFVFTARRTKVRKMRVIPGAYVSEPYSPQLEVWRTGGKPRALMESIVADFTDPDDLILDPFAGSGTTGAAALRLGRRVILVEREAKWAELCRERLEAEQDGSTLRAKRAGQVPLFAVAK